MPTALIVFSLEKTESRTCHKVELYRNYELKKRSVRMDASLIFFCVFSLSVLILSESVLAVCLIFVFHTLVS